MNKKRKPAAVALLVIFLSHAGIYPSVAFPFPPQKMEMGSFWAGEKADRDLRPHEAIKRRDEFLRGCAAIAPNAVADRFACRLVNGERAEDSGWLALPFARWFQPKADLGLAELKELPFQEKTLWEARAYVSPLRPPAQKPGQGWLALESTVRLAPRLEEPRWWRYQALLAERDPARLVANYEAMPFASDAADPNRRDRLDGVSYGIAPFVGLRSFRGGVVGLRLWDDRLGDKNRAAEISVQAATNATFFSTVAYTEGEWLAPIVWRVDTGAYSDQFRYVANTGTSRFREEAVQASTSFTVPLVSAFYARVGGRVLVKGDERVELAGPFAANPGSTLGGPLVGLRWDSLDSHTTPRSGVLVDIEAMKNLGAFWEARVRTGIHRSFSRKFSASFTVAATAQEGTPRRNLLSGGGREWQSLPGIVENRYRAPAGIGASAELQHEMLRGLRALIFGTALGLRSSLAADDSFIAGGGLGAEIALSHKARPTLRTELAIMAGSFVFTADYRASF